MNNIAKKTVKAAVLLGVAALTCIAACSCTKTAKYEDDLSGYVTLGEYKGLTISSETIDEQLGSTINTLISKNTKTNDITDRALASGDTAKVKYTLTSGESEVETKDDYSVILGTATDLFAESLIGHSVGDEYTVDVTLPDDYSNADYAGKAATYSITVSSATETVVPELTDAFVAEKTDYETVDEYKAATRLDVRKNLLWEDVIAGCRFSSYPEKNIKIYYDNGIEYYNNLFNYYASLSGSSSSSGDIYSRFGTTKEKIYKQAADIVCKAGTFVEVQRKFSDGDIIELKLPMKAKSVSMPYDGVAFERGPLVFSLNVKAQEEITETRELDGIKFQSRILTPLSEWNYAPVDTENIEVVNSNDYSNIWNPETTPVRLKVKAVTVTNWQLYRDNFTPYMPSVIRKGEEKVIELVPVGTTVLRMTVFPDIRRIPE